MLQGLDRLPPKVFVMNLPEGRAKGIGRCVQQFGQPRWGVSGGRALPERKARASQVPPVLKRVARPPLN